MTEDNQTRRAVEALYRAYLAGDPDGMLATMDSQVEVRFLGRGTYRGLEEAGRFLRSNTPLLRDLDFRIRKLVVDGRYAAALWEETARTPEGHPYHNHGVDVFEVRNGKVTVVHENNDVAEHRRHFRRVDS